MYCENCGNLLEEKVQFCNKCGKRVTVVNSQNQTNLFSIVGLIVACISLFLNFWGIVGIAAVILSSIGLIQSNQARGQGRGVAITGILLGVLSIIYAFMVLLLLV
ncbi:MAG: zinc-ribbon domain-containing protein [Clostridia bacterium]|nr:zinc-ribbon domain-containing protein [Clostridia bacterium]